MPFLLAALVLFSGVFSGIAYSQEVAPPAPPAPAEPAPSKPAAVFDADAFFADDSGIVVKSSGEKKAPTSTADEYAGTPVPFTSPPTQGLVIHGEGRTDVSYAIGNPFKEESGIKRRGHLGGGNTIQLDGTAGDRNVAKVDVSVIGSYAYNSPSVGGGSSEPQLAIKKLYLSVFTPQADIFAGRMILNYGRGTVLSPADLFSGIDTRDIALGRTGTDAARVLVPLGPVSGLDFVSTLDREPKEATAGMRAFGNIKGWDFGTAAYFEGREEDTAVFSLDFKGDAVVGVSAEAVGYVPLESRAEGSEKIKGAAMLGLDYSVLRGDLVFDVEYQWNGSEGEQGSFRAEHTLFASSSWKVDDLSTLALRSLINLSDRQWQASLAASRSIARATFLSAHILYRTGDIENLYSMDQSPSLSFGINLAVSF